MKKQNVLNAVNNALAKITGKQSRNGGEMPCIRPVNIEKKRSWFGRDEWEQALVDVEGKTRVEIYKEEGDLAISKAKKRKEVLKEEYELEQNLWLESQKANLLFKSDYERQAMLSGWVEKIINNSRLTNDQQEHLLERAVLIIAQMNGAGSKKQGE